MYFYKELISKLIRLQIYYIFIVIYSYLIRQEMYIYEYANSHETSIIVVLSILNETRHP